MNNHGFPREFFCHSIVRLLDAIGYHDEDLTRDDRLERAHYIYTKATEFFTQPFSQAMLQEVEPARVIRVTQSISRLVTCAWTKARKDTQVNVTIFLSSPIYSMTALSVILVAI